MSKEVQPVFIFPEGTKRQQGRTAHRLNIQAAKLVAETVRTTLGPKGMDKMLVDNMNDVIITNDGVTILKEMSIEHPSAKMIVEVAKTQEEEVGDGTTTAVVLAGELLKKAEELLEMDIHPTVIARGYRLASERAIDVLEKMAEPITEKDKDVLMLIASTAMTGKGAEASKERLSRLAVDAVLQVMEKKNGKIIVDSDDIKVEKKIGASYSESDLISGVVIDKERVHSGMPKAVENPKIALVDSPLEIKNTEIDAKIQITDPSQLQAFLEKEESMLQEMVDRIVRSGANVLFCQKGIDDVAQHFLAKKGVYSVRRVKKSDMDRLAKATGGRVIARLSDLSEKDLGRAGLVEEIKVGDEDMTYVRDCHNPKAVTLLVRGSTEHVVDEIRRAMDDAIGDIVSAIRSGRVVGGAGAPETELALQLRKFAESLSGREQLAVQAFAGACEVIPRTLAENAGLDPIDAIAEVKAEHDKGKKWAGINVFTGKVMDSWKEGVIEPLRVKTQAFSSASEVAEMILRIDDVIAASPEPSQQGGGMPSGMPPGGMPEY